MPKNELLDNSHIGTVCTRVQFAANACPSGSVYGTATAVTPLLAQPLTGNVYLRASNHKLPDLVADLRGQFNIEVSARIDSVKGAGLRARFETVPDAPVSNSSSKWRAARRACWSTAATSARRTGGQN